ncbi:MAG: MATE family efflux transporter [Candidatus Muirbacterium halophilum]|nr:MATE family efflux transporter [Candidatus Muirbacterium halophilum]MCK9475948.1 MATE family efflux transporter [Candidatus Muirbacterium halophilum]
MKTQSVRLGTESIKKLIIELSIPAIFGMLLIAMYNIVDAFLISWGVGVRGLAGVTVALPFHLFLMAISQMLGIGAGSIISRALGKKEQKKADLTFSTTVITSFFIGILLAFLVYIFKDVFINLSGGDKETYFFAKNYVLYLLPGVPFLILLIAVNNIVRSEGNTKKAMEVMFISGIINIILDYIFIFRLNMNTDGVALATSISWIAGFFHLVFYFLNKNSSIRINIRNFKFKFNVLKEVIGIGAASFLRQISASILVIVLNNILPIYGGFGVIAVLGIINRINMFIFLPMFGVLQGVNPVIGYNFGAGNIKRVKEAVYFSVFLTSIMGLFYIVIIFFFSHNIFSFFSDDPILVKHGKQALLYSHIALLLAGFQIIASGLFQALGRVKVSLWVSLLRQFIFLIPLFFIMGRFFKLDGIWLSYPVSDVISSIVIFILVIREFKKLGRER